MSMPWMQVIDAVTGLADVALARRARKRAPAEEPQVMEPAALTARLAGVVAVAVKEALDRDSRRLDLEREQAEAARDRAERALALELLRQAGDREVGRLRLAAGIAAAGWLVTLFLALRLIGSGTAPRVVLGIGAGCLVAALGSVFAGLSHVNRSLARLDAARPTFDPSPAVALAAWFIVGGLLLASLAVLIA